tara:strand:+ start:9336 stop:9629 length:294 start_codon:yes stop_codon:yes gene_type:complete
MGVSIYAASSDPLEKAEEVASNLSFPIGWGVERPTGDSIGSFWDDRGNYVQPSEFVVTQKGRVISSNYSSSPIGRMDPEEAIVYLNFVIQYRNKAKG